jgi:DNA-binding response OmpR family regulator
MPLDRRSMMERLTRRVDDRLHLLVVDDDPRLRRLLRLHLERAGYHVLTVDAPGEALELAELEPPDLILLDVMMPAMDGLDFLARLRGFSDVPVILLTAKGEERDKVRGLDAGADDYITKPFSQEELLARVRAALRRRNPSLTELQEVIIDDLTINFSQRRVSRGGVAVRLTPTEYKLLAVLAAHPGKVVLHHELLTRVWGPEYRDQVDYLWTYVRFLRAKIESDPAHPHFIVSEHSVGYMLTAGQSSGPGSVGGNCGSNGVT